MTTGGPAAPTIFVTYAHDTEDHTRLVRVFSEFLVRRGFDVLLDQWAEVPRPDWSQWAEQGMARSDFIVVVASRKYKQRSDGDAGDDEGWGSQYEARVLRELLTAQHSKWMPRVLPVLLPGHDLDELPLYLQPRAASHYPVTSFDDQGAEDLLRALTGVAKHEPPPLGELWTPPRENADGTRDRLIAPTRGALTDPERLIIPLQRRDNLHQVFLPAVRQAMASPAIVAVHAEAGMGKSVLLAQLNDELAAVPDVGVVLVSTSAKTPVPPTSATELDLQFGAAVGRPGPLSELVTLQRGLGFRPVVLLDTLDLMLDQSTRVVISEWLRRLVDLGVPVVLTCRTFDFRTQLEPLSERVPLISTRVDRKEIYRLSETETKDFARSYLETQADLEQEVVDGFVDRLLHLRAQRRAVVEVCGSPLLLALTCQLYGRGEVPEDLTVARLFQSYWHKHVLTSSRRALTYLEADERRRTCTGGGRQILAESTATFAEEFRPGELNPAPSPRTVDDLRSEGVLVPGSDPTSFRFFHQSFAEWVIALHVMSDSADRAAFTAALADPVRLGYLAPVLLQLLYGLPDGPAYQEVVDSLDLSDLLIFRAVALSAVIRGDVARLGVLAGQAVTPPRQQHLLEALGTAAEDVSTDLLPLVVSLMANADDAVVFVAAKALGSVAAQTPVDRAEAVDTALLAAVRRRRELADELHGDQLLQVVLAELVDAPAPLTGAELAGVRKHYSDVGPIGRAQIFRLHHRAEPVIGAELLRIAVAHRLPTQHARAAARIAETVNADPQASRSLGWTGWRTTLACRYAKGWDDVQYEVVAADVLDRRGATFADLLELATGEDDLLAQRALHVTAKVTQRSPSTAIDLLVSGSAPTHRRCADLVLGGSPRPAVAASYRLLGAAKALNWFDPDFAAKLLTTKAPGAAVNILRWINSVHQGTLTAALDAAVSSAADKAQVPVVADELWQAIGTDVRRSGPLRTEADHLLARTVDMVSTLDDDADVDLLRARMKGILQVLLIRLDQQPEPGPAAAGLRTLLRRVFAELRLDLLDEAEDAVKRLITRSPLVFRTETSSLLDDLLADLPNLGGKVQLGVAMAVFLERGETSAEFRALAGRASDQAARSFVIAHLT